MKAGVIHLPNDLLPYIEVLQDELIASIGILVDRGYTMQYIANEVGISRQFLYVLCSKKCYPSTPTICQVRRLIDVLPVNSVGGSVPLGRGWRRGNKRDVDSMNRRRLINGNTK